MTQPPSSETNFDFRGKYTQTNALTRRLLDGFFGSIQSLLAGKTVASALEAGCGEGFSTARLRQMLPADATFEASDVEHRLVAEAQARNPGITIRQESIYELNRPDRSVDLVLALEVLEHLEEPRRALKQLCRVSRKWVIASVPREPIWCMLNLARLKYITHLGNTPGHSNHWTSRGFRRFLGRKARVLDWRKPLPWTIVLAEVAAT